MTGRGFTVWLVGIMDRLARILPHDGAQTGRRPGEWG
jgi:hypothetical protein